ncbi:hypothetical protein [Nesterenkonia halotolerans]|uniref:RNase H-like HicB family nuclease n=1 Tax=Nesterenkonia halotolerans TaxID=225325 RepID=A0ABR9J7D8_9MICC|nr:hypothetical protein [Nesterenkonia halotolerans]MBE1514913.1 putative RNase H-like HicB family nuclease [Nesterenkonia halotolerans]
MESEPNAASAGATLSPALAAAREASQELLDRLDEDPRTRLLLEAEMAEYAQREAAWPSESVRKHRLIAVRHEGKTFYPAFQIDPVRREPREWVPAMIGLLKEAELTGRSFAMWAANSCPRFGGAIPADRADDPDFLTKAAGSLADI